MVVEGEGPWGSVVWQRGALVLEVPLSLEEPVLLGPPEGKQRIWLGRSCDRSCISYRFHTQLLCVDVSGVD